VNVPPAIKVWDVNMELGIIRIQSLRFFVKRRLDELVVVIKEEPEMYLQSMPTNHICTVTLLVHHRLLT
jgi:hypothetical protein